MLLKTEFSGHVRFAFVYNNILELKNYTNRSDPGGSVWWMEGGDTIKNCFGGD